MDITVFKYNAMGVPDLRAEDYLYSDNPLGPTLCVLMKPSNLGTVAQMYHSLRAVAVSRLDDARKALLTNVIETYTVLSAEEKFEFEQLVNSPEAKEVADMISVYEQRGIEKGVAQGVAQIRETLLRQMRLKFGDVPGSIRTHIEEISNTEALGTIADRIILSKTLEEVLPTEN